MSEANTTKSYVTPLPGVFAGLLQRALNEQLAGNEDLHKLANRVLGLELKGTGLTLFFQQQLGQLMVSVEPSAEVATWIRGTPKALFGMARPQWSSATDQVMIEGDAGLVRDFESIMRQLDFDWEQKLSGLVGDVAAHQLGVVAKKVASFAKGVIDLGSESVAEGLQQGVRRQADGFTSTKELAKFSEQVTALSDSVEALESRLATPANQ